MDRLNTQDMLLRRHWNVSGSPLCVMCATQARGTRDHLFFNCNFDVRVWNYMQIDWPSGVDMKDIAVAARRNFTKPFFTNVVFWACWNIWIIRNARVFSNERPSFNKWRRAFIHDISLMAHRIKSRFGKELIKWVSFLPP